MKLGLQGKVVVITGGTSGIGKAGALAFAEEGCRVAVCGQNPEKLANVKREFSQGGGEWIAEAVDVSNYNALLNFARDIVNQWGRIDIWINNAGIYPNKPIIAMDEAEWDNVMNVNLKSVFFGCKIAALHMKDRDGGVILNASSFTALVPSVGSGAYGATKAAILNLTRTLAAELAPSKIRVNAYIPGMIRTEMTREVIAKKGPSLTEQIALNRLGDPEDIAGGLVFLASDAARYMTGSYLEMSGGKLCVQNSSAAW